MTREIVITRQVLTQNPKGLKVHMRSDVIDVTPPGAEWFQGKPGTVHVHIVGTQQEITDGIVSMACDHPLFAAAAKEQGLL